jgi:hypothetical protein
VLIVWITSVTDSVEHALTDDIAVGATAAGSAQALCGATFVAAPIAAPPGRPCRECARTLGESAKISGRFTGLRDRARGLSALTRARRHHQTPPSPRFWRLIERVR